MRMVDNTSVEAEADTQRAAMRHKKMTQHRIEPPLVSPPALEGPVVKFPPPLSLRALSSRTTTAPKWGVAANGKKSSTVVVVNSGRSRSESPTISNRSSGSITNKSANPYW